MDIGWIVRFSWTTILTRRRARMKGEILGCLEHEGKSTGSHPNEKKRTLVWGIRGCR